jgi:FtsP/CotA-like multicopper oxidase with cupredoxin domain
MGVLARAGSLAVLSFVAVGVSVAAVPFRAPGTAGVAAVAATAATQPCIPNSPAPGVLPNPPVIDATVNKQFTIFVMQGPTTQNNGSAVQHFCYVTSPAGALNYVEAPTIRVRQGGTFRMTLINRIPGGPTPLPTPRSAIIPTSDGCAWLPFDGPMPTPNPGLLPPGYFNHARVPTQPDVPWMASNDTNFHTHGWHVDPYVDNVYKSLVWAPNPNSCVYTFSIPLTQPPGTYWYHAHLHGLSYEQVGGGLAGALIVESASPSPEPAAVLLVVKNAPGVQATLPPGFRATARVGNAMGGMFDATMQTAPDALAAHYANLAAPVHHAARALAGTPVPFPAFSPPPWSSGFAWPPAGPSYCSPQPPTPSALGDPLAVNGALIPVVLGGRATPAIGPAVRQLAFAGRRYRIIDAAADTYINVQTRADDGSIVPLVVLARDGVPVNWNFETNRVDPTKPDFVVEPNVFVPPSGRVDIRVTPLCGPLTIVSTAGTMQSRSASGVPWCGGYLGSAIPQRNILRIIPSFAGARPVSLAVARPAQQHALPTGAGQLVADDLPKVTASRAVTFTMYSQSGPPNWNVTQTGYAPGRNPPPSVRALPFTERPFWLAPAGASPDPKYPYIPWVRVHRNAVEEWYLYNASGEIHAFHIHQLTFVALQSPFEATNPYQQVFLDTVALPAGMLTPIDAKPPAGSTPPITPSLTKILIDFRNVDPGVFVFHCHMLFHEDHGMMGVIEVLPN